MEKEQKITEMLAESNAIEGIYDVDSLQQAHIAWKFLISKKKLTVGTILKTHKLLMLNQRIQPDEKGYFRRCEVRIGYRFGMNYVKVPEAMKQWIVNANDVAHNTKKESEVFKTRIIKEHHINYEHIHPFIDGNGRTGRMLLAWEAQQIGLPIPIIKESERFEYYKWFK